MSHPRIEEVEDSDLEMSDPSEGDIEDFVESDILRRREPAGKAPAASSSSSAPGRGAPPSYAKSSLMDPSDIPFGSGQGQQQRSFEPQMVTEEEAGAHAGYTCLYPIYFDSRRSRSDGRAVPSSLAVSNPLAREIVNACATLNLRPVFEPVKTHPRDWANPGRVRVDISPESGNPFAAKIKNKHHLIRLVAQFLQKHPTTDHCASLKMRVPGIPLPDPQKPWPRPAVPRGWKMGELVPHWSPAFTGGGVNENMIRDMMQEVAGQGGIPGLMAAAGAGSDGPKKGKKG